MQLGPNSYTICGENRATCAKNERHTARKRPHSPASGAPDDATVARWLRFFALSRCASLEATWPATTTQLAAARVGADALARLPAHSLARRSASLRRPYPSALSHRVLRREEGENKSGAAIFNKSTLPASSSSSLLRPRGLPGKSQQYRPSLVLGQRTLPSVRSSLASLAVPERRRRLCN